MLFLPARGAARRRPRTWRPFLERLETRTVLSFRPPVFLPASEVTMAVETADFNLDGNADFVVANRGEFPGEPGVIKLQVFLGRGDGTFQDPLPVLAGENPTALVVADFNWDGYPDVASASYLTANVTTLLGNGNGTFQPPVFHRVGLLPRSLALGDFDWDGWWDLATGNVGETTISILRNSGSGAFLPARTFEAYPRASAYWVTAAFMNPDYFIDLVVADDWGNTVSVLLGNGDATFRPPVTYPVQQAPRGVAVADFNGDGSADVAVVNQFNSTVSILLNNEGASLRPAVHYATGNGPQHVLAVDVNQDGFTDLVTANIYSNVASLLLGNGDGTFRPAVHYYVNDYGAMTAAADFNNDYWPDLVVARADDPLGDAVVLLNAADWFGGSPGGGGRPGEDDPRQAAGLVPALRGAAVERPLVQTLAGSTVPRPDDRSAAAPLTPAGDPSLRRGTARLEAGATRMAPPHRPHALPESLLENGLEGSNWVS